MKKAFLLAAGFGTRLRPLTNTTPKCLIDICGKPLMAWWIDLFEKHGIEEVLVNTHYLPEQVRGFIQAYHADHNSVHIIEAYEPKLLGSGGTVSANRDFIGDDEDFLICYADNLTNVNLSAISMFHGNHDGLLTMALFHTNDPSQCGIAVLDDQQRIIEFVEKPGKPKSNLANAGIYVANRRLFELLPKEGFCDFGKDILPKLVGQMYGWTLNEFLIDIGTPKNLEKAREVWNDYL